MNITTFDRIISEGKYHPIAIMLLHAHFVEQQSLADIEATYLVSKSKLYELVYQFESAIQEDKEEINFDNLRPQFA